MEKSQKPQFVQMILALAATFRTEATEPLYEGYWMGLGDLSLGRVKAAAVAAMHSQKFMPTVAELRELAGAHVPTPEERSTRAWMVVMDGRVGYYDSVAFDDSVIHATIRAMGGWMRFWERLEEEGRKWLCREFEQTYVRLMATGFSVGESSHLVGFHEMNNGRVTRYSSLKRIAVGLPAPNVPQLAGPPRRRLPCGLQDALR
jgi:hypothetical protein